MKTKCNHCNKEYKIENKYDGYLMECPECKESFLVEELDNILVKKSIKGILKKNPALVGAACCLFLAVILNFISNFFFLLWGPLYLVVFILGIVAIVQQKPFKGISFIVASLLLPLIICLVNIFWVGAVLNDAIKNKNKRNFYKTSAKSKKIQMDFFNTDPFANSSSIKKQIKKTKHKYSLKKIEKAQKKLKPINKPVIVLTSPASPKETKVSPVSTKKRDELNNKKLINVYSGSMKPQPIINTKRKVKVHQVSAVLFKRPHKRNDKKQFSKKIVERLILKNLSRNNKKYYVKFSRILAWSKNEANWKIGITFVKDNKKEKEIVVKLNDILKFGKDKYKLCYIEMPKWVVNYKKDHRFKGKKESFRVLHRNDKIYLRNVNSGEGVYIKFNKKWRYSDISATLIDSHTKKTYVVKNKKILKLENNNNYKVKLSYKGSSKHVILINDQGKKYYIKKSSNLINKNFQSVSNSRIKRIIVGKNSVDFK